MDRFMTPQNMGLMGLAAGLLQSSGASPREITLGEGLGNGMQQGMQGMQQGMQMQLQKQNMGILEQEALAKQEKLKNSLQTKNLLEQTLAKQQSSGDMSPVSIGNALIATNHPELMMQGMGILKDFRSKVKTTNKVLKDGQEFTQPIFDDGSFGEVNSLPNPVRPMQVNQGSQVSFIDPNSLQYRGAVGVGMSPGEGARLAQSERQFGASHGLAQQNALRQAQELQMKYDPAYQAQMAAAKAGGKESGVSQVKAATELPGVIEQGEQTIKLVDDLLTHPGFKLSVGKSAPLGSLASMVPGTEPASFDIALNQLKGKQFLEAFQSLKGGGAITEIEGEKATQAMSRMEKSNTEEEFTKASREFQGILKQGINRAKQKAGVGETQQPVSSGGYSVRRLD